MGDIEDESSVNFVEPDENEYRKFLDGSVESNRRGNQFNFDLLFSVLFQNEIRRSFGIRSTKCARSSERSREKSQLSDEKQFVTFFFDFSSLKRKKQRRWR